MKFRVIQPANSNYIELQFKHDWWKLTGWKYKSWKVKQTFRTKDEAIHNMLAEIESIRKQRAARDTIFAEEKV